MNPLPCLEQAYSLLVQEERQRQVKNATHFLNDSASSFRLGTQRATYEAFQRRPEGRRVSQRFYDYCKR